MSSITSPAWQAIPSHSRTLTPTHLRELFAVDPDRFSRFSIEVEDLLVDFSKQRIDSKAIELLTGLAEAADLAGWRERLFAGEKINVSEGRAVLHPALRHLKLGAFRSAAWDVMPEVRAVREQMRAFSDSVRAGLWRGRCAVVLPVRAGRCKRMAALCGVVRKTSATPDDGPTINFRD